jgi:hypothetical protein
MFVADAVALDLVPAPVVVAGVRPPEAFEISRPPYHCRGERAAANGKAASARLAAPR